MKGGSRGSRFSLYTLTPGRTGDILDDSRHTREMTFPIRARVLSGTVSRLKIIPPMGLAGLKQSLPAKPLLSISNYLRWLARLAREGQGRRGNDY